MKTDYVSLLLKAAIACYAIAAVLFLYYTVAPFFIGNVEALRNWMLASAMGLVFLAGVLAGGYGLILVHEVVTSKNKKRWKAIWSFVILAFGLAGIAAYTHIGRAERKP